MQNNLLQSESWASFQKSLGKTVFHEISDSFEYFAILEKTKLGTYLFVPYGPLIDDNHPKKSLKSALKSLKSLAAEHHCLFVRIEPRYPFEKSYLESLKLKKSHDLNPADTWILDLEKDASELIPSRLLRYYRNMEKNNLSIITSKNPADVHYLSDLQSAFMKSKNLSSYDENYYKKQLSAGFATLYLLKQSEKVLSAGLVFDDSTTRYNLQGAQSDSGRTLHATGIMTVQLILDSIENRQKTFDFWGIAPDGAPKSHPWAGFTGFKKTFSGTPVHYSGTYDFPTSARYPLYQALRLINRLILRIKSKI